MKLTELEPTLDPRRPLHFGAPRADVRPRLAGSACVAAGSSRDLRSADLGDPAELRTRAAASLRLFTGAGTGLIVAVWRHRAAQFEAELRARQAELVRPDAVAGSADNQPADSRALPATTDAAQDAWSTLADFGALSRAFAGGVRALSPLAAAALAGRPAEPEGALPGFDRRADWGNGVLCTPDGLLAWSTTAEGTHLVEITGSGLVTLTSESVAVPRWSAAFVAGDAGSDAVAPGWRRPVALLGRLAALGTVTPAPVADGDLPVTRLVLTAGEARTGVEPVDLTTGAAPTVPFTRARFRETFSTVQNRWVRVFVDVTWQGTRPAPARVLVTVLPQ